jgi:hypothetical protein
MQRIRNGNDQKVDMSTPAKPYWLRLGKVGIFYCDFHKSLHVMENTKAILHDENVNCFIFKISMKSGDIAQKDLPEYPSISCRL